MDRGRTCSFVNFLLGWRRTLDTTILWKEKKLTRRKAKEAMVDAMIEARFNCLSCTDQQVEEPAEGLSYSRWHKHAEPSWQSRPSWECIWCQRPWDHGQDHGQMSFDQIKTLGWLWPQLSRYAASSICTCIDRYHNSQWTPKWWSHLGKVESQVGQTGVRVLYCTLDTL